MNTLVFEEYFQDNRHGWSEQDSDECVVKIVANSYLFDGSWLAWNYFDAKYFRPDLEFQMHVVLEKLSGNNGNYGIIWSLVDIDRYIDFVISDQTYQIRKKEAGNWITYASGQIFTAFSQPRNFNLLEIRRKAEVLEFYLNSWCISQLSADILLPGSAFGLVVYDQMKVKAHSIIITINETESRAAHTDDQKTTSESHQSDKKLQASCLEHHPPENDTLDRVFADLNDLIGHQRTNLHYS